MTVRGDPKQLVKRVIDYTFLFFFVLQRGEAEWIKKNILQSVASLRVKLTLK